MKKDDMLEKARDLKKMLDEGIITKDEFDRKKDELLSSHAHTRQEKHQSSTAPAFQTKTLHVVFALILCVILTLVSFSIPSFDGQVPSPFAVLYLVQGIVFMMITVPMATKRGRDTALALLGGYVFGIFSVAYYAIAGDTTEMRVFREENARKKYAK